MPTKFVVLWLKTLFITNEEGKNDTKIDICVDYFPSLEES